MTQRGAPAPGMGTRAGRKAQRKHPFRWHGVRAAPRVPAYTALNLRVGAANVPGTASTGTPKEQKGCCGGEEEAAGSGGARGPARDGAGTPRAAAMGLPGQSQSPMPGTGGTATWRSWH